jgi:RNA processing factor Prp31
MSNTDEHIAKILTETKQAIAQSYTQDTEISWLIHYLDDVHKAQQLLITRLRIMWAHARPTHERTHSDEDLLSALLLGIVDEESMSGKVSPGTLKLLQTVSKELQNLHLHKEVIKEQLDEISSKLTPNLRALVGPELTARLVDLAGSLEKLASIPASTIQLLGAKKALFRHLVSGAKSPKHGIIIMHPLVKKSREKGRVARMIADKVAIAARVDFFKGEFCGDALLKIIEDKL